MHDNNFQPEKIQSSNNEIVFLLEENNNQVNIENLQETQQDCKNLEMNQDILLKEIQLIKNKQEVLITQINEIKDNQKLIINTINELKNDIKNIKKDSSDVHKRTVSTKRNQSRISKKYEPSIIPVAFLQEKGKESLLEKLEIMTDDELKQMNQLFLKKTKKELEKIDRQTMIEYLMNYAERELNRGSKFLEDR